MCGILINNQEFNIEKTKYILSNLIANRKQMDEEVFCSTVGQTILWANKGDEINTKTKFYSTVHYNCITDDGIPLKHYHSTEGFHPVV